jgi:protein gp37
MAERTKIQWSDNSFDPLIGRTEVTDGCKNCYASSLEPGHEIVDESDCPRDVDE